MLYGIITSANEIISILCWQRWLYTMSIYENIAQTQQQLYSLHYFSISHIRHRPYIQISKTLVRGLG